MPSLLYLEASPRGADAASAQAAQHFLQALPASVTVDRLPLFEADLPAFDATLAAAKYAIMTGQALSADLAGPWATVEALVARFKAADHYLFAVPMWNFGIPYVLKQYVDLITHPGMTFTMDASGIKGLVGGSATLIFSRGGDYSPKDGELDPYDLQTPYLRAWLGMVGIDIADEVLIQNTMAGPDALGAQLEAAQPRLAELAQSLGG